MPPEKSVTNYTWKRKKEVTSEGKRSGQEGKEGKKQ
jgi:hypothetical protein